MSLLTSTLRSSDICFVKSIVYSIFCSNCFPQGPWCLPQYCYRRIKLSINTLNRSSILTATSFIAESLTQQSLPYHHHLTSKRSCELMDFLYGLFSLSFGSSFTFWVLGSWNFLNFADNSLLNTCSSFSLFCRSRMLEFLNWFQESFSLIKFFIFGLK